MSFKILCVTATSSEADSLRKVADMEAHGNLEIIFLVTGVGSMATAWTLLDWISKNGKPDLAINAGIAGSYNTDYAQGDVVMPLSDCFADSGIEDGESFMTLFEAGLSDANEFPYENGLLYATRIYIDRIKGILKPVNAITHSTATGSDSSKIKLLKKFKPDIETMEGATFFYICSRENIPFLALRAVSNMVEKRNKDNWNISLALKNLSEKFNEVLLILH